MKQSIVAILLVVIVGTYFVDSQSKLECTADCFNAIINSLINAIMAGETSGCSALCAAATNNSDYLKICVELCDDVGITAFVDILNITDPSPIYICQELKACNAVPGGKVTITAAIVTPKSGPVRTTFNIDMAYTVVAATSPGLCIVTVFPPMDGEPLSTGNLLVDQDPGNYKCNFPLDTSYNVSDFPTGLYGVQFAVCSGDCTTAHPNSGIYAQANTNFTITS